LDAAFRSSGTSMRPTKAKSVEQRIPVAKPEEELALVA
jgi:hypothetical protein